MSLNRRHILAAGAALGLSACARQAESEDCAAATGTGVEFEWKMVTAWPPNFPVLGTGASRVAKTIEAASGGRIRVRVYGAGELVPAMEVFDTVVQGVAQLGHGAAYYWKGKHPATQFFAAVPFGLTAQAMNAWLYQGGGLELWRELYANFGLEPMPCGNTGVQMGGWFKAPVNGVADLSGLKMRIPGLGGDVLRRAGGVPVTLPGGEIFTALQSGAIDATEWVGPYNDLAFGLFRAAKHYYYPGWHEPGTTLELIVNQQALAALPDDLQTIVQQAAGAENALMLAEFEALNGQALHTLRTEHDVDIRRFPDDVLQRLRELSDDVVAEVAASNRQAQVIFDSFSAFRERYQSWHALAEPALERSASVDAPSL